MPLSVADELYIANSCSIEQLRGAMDVRRCGQLFQKAEDRPEIQTVGDDDSWQSRIYRSVILLLFSVDPALMW